MELALVDLSRAPVDIVVAIAAVANDADEDAAVRLVVAVVQTRLVLARKTLDNHLRVNRKPFFNRFKLFQCGKLALNAGHDESPIGLGEFYRGGPLGEKIARHLPHDFQHGKTQNEDAVLALR